MGFNDSLWVDSSGLVRAARAYANYLIETLEEKINEIVAIRIKRSFNGEKTDSYMIIKLKLFELVLKFLKLFVHKR